MATFRSAIRRNCRITLVAACTYGFATLIAHAKAADPVKIQEFSYPWGFQLSSIVFSPDGSLVAAGESGDIAETYQGPHILIWEVKSGKTLHRIRLKPWEERTGQIGALSFSPNGKHLLFCSSIDNTLRVWDFERSQSLLKINGQDEGFLGAIYSADGRYILSLTPKTIILFDGVKGSQIRRFPLPNVEIGSHTMDSLAFAPDGKSFISFGVEGIRLWEVNTGRMVRHITVPPGHARINYIGRAAITGDGQSVVGYCDANYYEFFVWNLQTGKLLSRFGNEPDPWYGVFSENGKLALASKFSNNRDPAEGLLIIWNTLTGTELFRIPTGSALDQSIALS